MYLLLSLLYIYTFLFEKKKTQKNKKFRNNIPFP